VARIRLTLAVAATAISACAVAGISSALGAHVRVAGAPVAAAAASAHAGGPRRHRGRTRCTSTVTVHAGGRYVLHRSHVRCHRRAARRLTRVHRRAHVRSTHHPIVRRARPLRRSPRALGPGRRTSAADVNGQCGDTQLTPSAWDIERVRAAVLCLVNHERATHGESALLLNPALAQAAQSHTESMAFGNYFEHVGPRGDTPLDRARSAGYITDPRRGFEVGENIAWGTLWLSSPRAIVAAWMASPAHRANILNARYRDTAVGVSPHAPASLAHGQSGGIYTQDFGVITR
jgi:uncharacterized protein YkwD